MADKVEVIRCKDCKHFHYDFWGIVDYLPVIVAHEICVFWNGGAKTVPEGYCNFAELREDEQDG